MSPGDRRGCLYVCRNYRGFSHSWLRAACREEVDEDANKGGRCA